MTSYVPRLSPYLSNSKEYKDRRRYEELGLPKAWITNCLKNQAGDGPDEYFWTPDEFFETDDEMTPDLLREIRACTGGCFFYLTLAEQCQILGVQLDIKSAIELAGGEVSIENIGKRGGTAIELFALKCFQSQGWNGDRCEGATFFLISDVVREYVEKAKVAYHPHEWRANRKPRVRVKLTTQETEILDKAIDQLDESQFAKLYELSLKEPAKVILPRAAGSGLTLDHVLGCWRALKAHEIRQYCELHMLGFHGMGWPDLTLHRNSEMLFVEVKQKNDKFTHRQPYWFRNFARPMGWNVKVQQIVI